MVSRIRATFAWQVLVVQQGSVAVDVLETVAAVDHNLDTTL
jgi:hypothetical protein